MTEDEQQRHHHQHHSAAAAAAMDVRVLSSHMVLPSPSSPHPPTLWTSNLDLVILNGYIKTVYFFPFPSSLHPSPSHHDDDIRRLRLSLASALSVFWPMAGRLSHDASGRLQIDCNDAGALFLHASCDSCAMDSLPGGFVPNPNLLRLVPSLDPAADLASSPLLLVQVTRFKCGGVAVGVGIEHHVADGKSAVKFLNSWASLSRGIPFTEKVNFDRSCLQARTPPTPEFVHEEYLSLPLPPNYTDLKLKKRKEVISRIGSSPDEAVQNGHGKRKHSPESNGDHQLDCNLMLPSGEPGEHGAAPSNGHLVAARSVEKNGHALGNGHVADNGHLEPASCVEKNGHVLENGHAAENGHGVGNGHHDADKNGHDIVENGHHHALNNGRVADKGQHVDSEGGVLQKGHTVESSDEDSDEEDDSGKVEGAAASDGGPASESAEEVVVQMVDISREFVQSLKEAGAEKKGLEKPLTSHEMLAAQVWRGVCEARKGGGETSRLIVAVDGRARMRGLPDGYFGNVIFTSVASATASEVAAAPAAETALRVRRALRKLDDPYCRSALDFLELEPDTWRFVKGAHTWAAPNVGFTSWAQLPMYDCDFGWGAPCHVGPAHVAWDGLAYVTNPTPAGVEAGVALRLIIALRRRHAAAFLPAFFRLHDDAAAAAV